MYKNIAAIATLLAFAEAVQLDPKPRFDVTLHNEEVDSCWKDECAKRAIEQPTPEEIVEEIEEEVDSVEEEIEEAIEEIVDPEPEPEEESEETEVEEEEEEEEEEPIFVLPPDEPLPEVFVEAKVEDDQVEILKEKTEELVEDFCGLPWEKELAPEVAEKALADAIDAVSNYEMAEEDELKILEGDN